MRGLVRKTTSSDLQNPNPRNKSNQGVEILRQHSPKIDAIFVCVGGGGLIAGVASYIKRVCPHIKIIGVETFDACSMTASLLAGKRVTLDSVGLFADGAAVKIVGEENFRLARSLVDEMVLVSTYCYV